MEEAKQEEPAVEVSGADLILIQKHEAWYDLFQQNCRKGGGRKKSNPSWGLCKEFKDHDLWFYCTVCYAKEPNLNLKLKKQAAGILKYDKANTSLIKNHCEAKHLIALSKFSTYVENMNTKRAVEQKDEQPFFKKGKSHCRRSQQVKS